MRKLSENEIKQVSGGDGNDGQAELIAIGAIAGTFLSPELIYSWSLCPMEPSIGVAVGSVVGAFCYGIGNSSLFSSSSVAGSRIFKVFCG